MNYTRRTKLFFTAAAVLLDCILLVCVAHSVAADTQMRYRRARWPKWDANKYQGLFFSDVNKEGLIAERPAIGREQTTHHIDPKDPNSSPDNETVTANGVKWSDFVSPETIEDEVKSLRLLIDQTITTPGRFASGKYVDARQHFSMLAMLFAVIAEYDNHVRWKEDAKEARNLFAHMASISQVGSIQVFKTAQQRRLDLRDLVRGAGLKTTSDREAADWSEVADRGPLMQRLEIASNERLRPWTARASTLAGSYGSVVHEAELVAMIAQALTMDGMTNADDDEYTRLCELLKRFSSELADAAARKNPQRVQQAMGEITKACAECHELYR